jgi:branched-chain amino acid transport system ATP-binding protein
MEQREMNAPYLETRSLSKAFGGVNALADVSLTVDRGEVHALIGPNGAGKSTLISVISGFERPDSGDILLGGKSVIGRRPYDLVRLGLARTFQSSRPVVGLSVLESVLLGMHIHRHASVLDTILRLPAYRRERSRQEQRALDILRTVGLGSRSRDRARDLSGAQGRSLEIAQIVATEAVIVLLDEPVAGMGATEIGLLADLVLHLRSEGCGILLVEHEMGFIFSVADRISVMAFGRVVDSGRPQAIRESKVVQSAYLGSSYEQQGGVADVVGGSE